MSSLFKKSKPIRDGPKKTPLSERVEDMPTRVVQKKHLSARQKASESAGAATASTGAKLLNSIPFVGSFVDTRKTVESGDDHRFRGLRIRERQQVLERDLARRNEPALPFENRGERWKEGFEKALRGDPARRV